MQRRDFLKLSVGTAAAAAFASRAYAQGAVKEIRIGYQKNGVLVIARQQSVLENHFKPYGIEVKWVEFSSGPPMMEAMNVGSIDAWSIWDPYFAIGETKQNGRILVNTSETTRSNSFYIANRDFARNHGPVLQQIVDVTTSAAKWAEAHRDEVARSLSAITGIPLDIQTIAANRASFAVEPITDDIVATQQRVADRFFKLGLIPKQITIRDIVWRNTQT